MTTDWADEKAQEWLALTFGLPYPGDGGYAPSISRSIAALLREVQQQERERITGIVEDVRGEFGPRTVAWAFCCDEILRRIEGLDG